MASNKTVLALLTNHDANSYPVTPDVGKVGNESPTFVEPISKRKDGIEAMFASQGSQNPNSSPAKRRRSTSPPPAKKPKIANAKEESDSGVELVGYGKSNPKVRGTRSMAWGRGSKVHIQDKPLSPVKKSSQVFRYNLWGILALMSVAEGPFKFTTEAIFTTKFILTGMTRATRSDNLLTTTTGQKEGKG